MNYQAGGVEIDEGSIQTFKREMAEELGVQVNKVEPLGVIIYDFNILHLRNIATYYLAHVEKAATKHYTKIELEQFESIKWIKVDELMQLLKNPHTQNVGKLIHRRESLALMEYLRNNHRN